MADSKLPTHETDSSWSSESDEELVQCGICLAIIDNPKALPCLHTFCQKCLSDWAESSARKQPDNPTTVVSCPSCREECSLPRGGVDKLKTNFFVTKLKERKSIQRKLHTKDAKVPCTSCCITDGSSTNAAAVSRCVDCNDFLCNKCVEVHKSVRVLRRHQLFTLDELRSGKLAIHNLPEQEMCPKHKGEVIRFYCETCDEPMCRDCTVVDHPRPDHKQVDLESAAGERSATLLKLAEECQPLAKEVECAIEADEKTMGDLDAALERATNAIKQGTEAAVTSVLEALKMEGKAKQKELQLIAAKRRKDIECHKESLELIRIRTRTALEMTHQVTQKGSEHDVATMYSSLTNTMTQLRHVKPTTIRKSIGKLEFKPNEDIVKTLGRIGTLKTYGQWVLEKSFGQGQFNTARCAVFNMAGDIVVTDMYQNIPVKVFGRHDGQVKLSINTAGVGGGDYQGYSRPWGLAIGKDGQYFMTDLNPYVKVFDAQGKFKHRFGTKIANGQWSYDLGSEIYGLAIDGIGRVFVGNYSPPYVSIHNQDDGSQVSGFPVKIAPYFIATSSNQRIIVSDHYRCEYAVYVYDDTGNLLQKCEVPEGVATWYPTGMCCSQSTEGEEEVYIACKGSPRNAIYRYSLTGKYLGIFTKDVVIGEPWGVSINEDGDELAVVDKNTVKIFQLE